MAEERLNFFFLKGDDMVEETKEKPTKQLIWVYPEEHAYLTSLKRGNMSYGDLMRAIVAFIRKKKIDIEKEMKIRQ